MTMKTLSWTLCLIEYLAEYKHEYLLLVINKYIQPYTSQVPLIFYLVICLDIYLQQYSTLIWYAWMSDTNVILT